MRKQSLVISVIIAMAVAFLCSMGFAKDAEKIMTLNSTVYKKHKKALVKFSHEAHAKDEKYGPVPCADCHHVYKDGKNVWKEGDEVQKCQECHKEAKAPKAKKGEPKMSKEEKILKYHYSAIHANCVGCHKKVAKKDPGKKEIAKCTACHPKEKK